VAGFGLMAFIVSFKAVGLLMHLSIVLLIYKIAETIKVRSGSRAAIIYGMNPLAIFELVANAHNDGLAIFMLLFTLYMLFQKKTLNALITLGVAVSFKFTAMLSLPFIIIRAARDRGLVYAGLGIVLTVSVAAFFYIITCINLFDVLQTSTFGFINFSFPALFYTIAGGNVVPIARAFGLIIFFSWSYVLLRRQISGKSLSLNITIGLCFTAYLLFGAYMVHRWYYLWPLALTASTPNNPWTKAVLAQTIILLPCYTLTLAFGEVNIDKSVTYILSLLPVIVTGLLQYYHRLSINNR
jgi:Gpi18-like mannosyltransferase